MSDFSEVVEKLVIISQRLSNIETAQDDLGAGLTRILSQTRQDVDDVKKNSFRQAANRTKYYFG